MESYAYNEEKMMAGIEAYRQETKLLPPIKQIRILLNNAARTLMGQVAKRFAVSPAAILSSCKEPCLVRAREVIVLILRREYGYSLTRIGCLLNRHHTTIMNEEAQALKHYEELPSFRAVVDELSTMKLHIKRDEAGLPLRGEL